jgi:tetratricopeptide (TPR) repeat protein
LSQLRIFVSHSYQDKPFADALVRALRGAGADVWYDEHNLGAGHLLDEISEQVRARPVFLVVLSPAAFDSNWVKQECQWALNLFHREAGRVILPITAQPIKPTDFNTWLFLENFRRVEAPGFLPHPEAEAIARTLQHLTLTSHAAPAMPQLDRTVSGLIARGKELIAENDCAGAISVLKYAARLGPDTFSVWFHLGYARNELGYWEEGREAFAEALRIKPEDGAARSNYGKALLGVREFDEALRAFERALALDESIALRWAGKGFALKWLTRYEDALHAFNQALALDRKYGEALAAKANVLWLLQRHDEAIKTHGRATKFNEDVPLPWTYKAITLRALTALGSEDES